MNIKIIKIFLVVPFPLEPSTFTNYFLLFCLQRCCLQCKTVTTLSERFYCRRVFAFDLKMADQADGGQSDDRRRGAEAPEPERCKI